MGATPQRWIHWFSDPPPQDAADLTELLGGKGASLKEMARAGLAVPPGFTISTQACRRFFELGETFPESLEEELRKHLTRLEEETQRRFGRGEHPLLVSVRSGAAVSMPGMMDTVLNCGALGEPYPSDPWDQLLACVEAVFRSFHSDRADAYRRRKSIEGLAGTAVTVQAMFPSDVSGVLFTQDPTAPAANRMVIEAAPGLGEAVVSGKVTPDRFLVNRDYPARVTSTLRDPNHPTLTADQIHELCELGYKIEDHFGHPVDLEWGFAEGAFALLQARAIRGLEEANRAAELDALRREEIARLAASANGARRVWVAHNLGETLPTPTPLTWDIMRRFMSGAGGFGRMYRQLGYRPSAAVCRDGFLELIGGNIYANPDRLAGMFWGSLSLTYDLDALANDRTLLESGPTRFDPDRAHPALFLHLPATLWSMTRVSKNLRRLRRSSADQFEKHAVPPYIQWIQEERQRDLSQLSDEELLAELSARRVRTLDDFGPESMKPGFAGAMAYQSLKNKLVQLGGPVEGGELANTLTSALDGDTTFQQNAMLHDVARGEATLASFLEKFGHRAAQEMELAQPRWRQDAAYLEQAIARLAAASGPSPQEIHEENLARRREAEAALPQTLAAWGGSSFRESIEADLHTARRLLPYRESGKHYLMMGYELIREAIEELARRRRLGERIYFLKLVELPQVAQPSERDRLDESMEKRRSRWQTLRGLDLPEWIDSTRLDELREPVSEGAGAQGELTGTGVAPGTATGTAFLASRPEEAGDLPEGAILVCPSTDPGWTPLFASVRALVMQRGGVLSHGAIVARDFGLPAVVCSGAMRAISPGDQIRVDGGRGTVSIVERAEP